VAAIAILFESIHEWMSGLQLQHLGWGVGLILMAGILNGGLGLYLVRAGRRTNSLILVADGKHVLTDSWTSFGVVAGLGLVMLTHWKPFDPLVAIAVAINILWSGDAWSAIRSGPSGLLRSGNRSKDPRDARHYLF